MQALVALAVAGLARLLLAPAGHPRQVLPRPRREQPHPRPAHPRPARTALRPQGADPGREPLVLQRGGDHRAQRRPAAAPWSGSPSSSRSIRRKCASASTRRGRASGRSWSRRTPPTRTSPPSRRVASRSRKRAWTSCRCAPIRSGRAWPTPSGHVGEISDRQLETSGFEELEAGSIVGQAGVELQYNRELMGQRRPAAHRREQPRRRGHGGGAQGARGRSARHAHHRPRPADGGRVEAMAGQVGQRGGPGPEQRRDPGLPLHARATIRTRSRRGSRPRSGRTCSRTRRSRSSTGPSRAVTRRAAPSRSSTPWPRCRSA